MSELKMATELKEKNSLEKNQDADSPVMRDGAKPRLETKEGTVSESAKIQNAALEKQGLTTEGKGSEIKENAEQGYAKYLKKEADGKYYDKETNKLYDSPEDWQKAQETLEKRYNSTADYWKMKAGKEWARYKNADKNGESEGQKWQHYRNSQEYYAKVDILKEKAEKIREKLDDVNRN